MASRVSSTQHELLKRQPLYVTTSVQRGNNYAVMAFPEVYSYFLFSSIIKITNQFLSITMIVKTKAKKMNAFYVAL